MNIDKCYKIGYVQRPHGLKGEVTIMLSTDSPESFDGIETMFLEREGRLIPYFIASISVRGLKAFVKFDEVDTPEAAQSISKSSLYLPLSTRPKSGKGQFYDDEVIDFEVVDSELGVLGNVSAVIQAGPNRLLSVLHHEKEVLIPVNGPFITGINKSKRKISTTLPEGFLDI